MVNRQKSTIKIPLVKVCIVCKGEYMKSEEFSNGKYHYRICKWCTEGVMTKHQLHTRQEYKRIMNFDKTREYLEK